MKYSTCFLILFSITNVAVLAKIPALTTEDIFVEVMRAMLKSKPKRDIPKSGNSSDDEGSGDLNISGSENDLDDKNSGESNISKESIKNWMKEKIENSDLDLITTTMKHYYCDKLDSAKAACTELMSNAGLREYLVGEYKEKNPNAPLPSIMGANSIEDHLQKMEDKAYRESWQNYTATLLEWALKTPGYQNFNELMATLCTKDPVPLRSMIASSFKVVIDNVILPDNCEEIDIGKIVENAQKVKNN